MKWIVACAVATLFCLFSADDVFAQKVAQPNFIKPEWIQPFQPFRIAGNLYYVGTYDLGCYLITTTKGNILINTGVAGSDTVIKKNIQALGFSAADIRIILITQAHYDHVGGLADIKHATHAQLMIDEKDADVLEKGGSNDYYMGRGEMLFKPIKADRLLKDGDSIVWGETVVVMLHHPGHTKGSCSYLLTVQDSARDYKVLIANMPSIIVDTKFKDVETYPQIQKDYAYTLSAMKKISFDVWVATHASQFNLHEKHKPGDAYNPSVFMGRKDYDDELKEIEKDYQKKL